MEPEQERHLQHIKDEFNELVDAKYRKGAQEHGGNLWEAPNIIGMAIEEALDQVTYLLTLKVQINNLERQNLRLKEQIAAYRKKCTCSYKVIRL
jgi:hypothetical protein